MRTGVIYTGYLDGKRYIGKALDFERRKYMHLRAPDDTHFHRAIKKSNNTVAWRILQEDVPENYLCELEKRWITFYKTYETGYNMTRGGDSGCGQPRSKETRDKISKSMSIVQSAKAAKGELPQQTEEGAKQISDTLKKLALEGNHPSQQPESRKKFSATMKEKAKRGEHHSQRPEVRAKKSATFKKKAAEGNHPMQDPVIAAKQLASRKATLARKRLEKQKASGQLTLF